MRRLCESLGWLEELEERIQMASSLNNRDEDGEDSGDAVDSSVTVEVK